LPERFVTLQEPIQGTQFAKRFGRKGPAHMLVNEASEPLAQSTSLVRNLVQFTRHRSRLQLIECIRWNKLGLSQPLQEAIAAVEPVNWFIDRYRDGIQEIEAERVGDKNCRRSVLHDWPPSKQAKELSRITYQTAIDKLCCARHNLSSAIELVMSRWSLDLRSSGMAIKDVSLVLAHRAWADTSWAAPASAITSLSDDVAALNCSLSSLMR